MALLTLLGVAALGTALLVMSEGDHQVAANERDAERALFASKAGLNHAFHLYEQSLIEPIAAGAPFDSLDPAVAAALQQARFAGRIYDETVAASRGQLYRIESTGFYRKGRRTTELVFQIVPEAFKYGYMAFNQAVLHNHSGLAGPSFSIESTIFSNGTVEVPEDITLEGTIVAADRVTIKDSARVKGSIFANALTFSGSGQVVEGDVTRLTAVESLPSTASSWDRLDGLGSKYDWFAGLDTPGAVNGSGTILGSQSAYTIQNGDVFRYSITRRDGRVLSDPDLNVILKVDPPRLNYAAMKLAADADEPTYFTSGSAALAYLATKKVTEVIGGKTLHTIRVGTSTVPEFLYVDGNFKLELKQPAGNPNDGDDPAAGELEADGLQLEGGIYVSGDFEFNGPAFSAALHPAPPAYYQLEINALPYCLPAIVAYPEPATGSISSWTSLDTPAMTGGSSSITVKSQTSPHEGFVYLNGVTYSESETHLHHTQSADEMIRFIGAELAFKVHNCDYFQFTYDPAVVCTRFLVSEEGSPLVVSYRELR